MKKHPPRVNPLTFSSKNFFPEKKFSGKKIINKVIKFCNELSKNDHRVVLLNSSNNIDWVLFYLAAKLKNKIVFFFYRDRFLGVDSEFADSFHQRQELAFRTTNSDFFV